MIERSCSKHIVLIGIGHTNAHIVRMWGMNPIPDTDLTCISDAGIATYSGMLPAVLAGQIPPSDMQIDLVRLCSSVGARLITDPVKGIDHNRREVTFDDRPPVGFDVLSIGIGSVPTIRGVEISGDSLIKIKPMQTFLQRLKEKVVKLHDHIDGQRDLKVTVVGSGAAGIEIFLCLPNFLREHVGDAFELQLVTRSEKILPSVGDAMRDKTLEVISNRGQTVVTQKGVTKVVDGQITLSDNTTLDADLVVWATGASAPDNLQRFAMPLTDNGFIATNQALQSTGRRNCFAVGDTGTIVDERLPKAGVYAVRQGPILWENLHRSLESKTLKQYKPQRSFLRLLNTGDGSAIGQWKGRAFSGGWVMRLKEFIDGRFMEKYQVGEMMADGDDGEMQCRGCGCKLGADALDAALDSTVPLADAATIDEQPGKTILASTDFFTSPLQDAYLAGRIAALHSASDIIATGGRATHALGNVVLPEGSEATQQRTLGDFVAGARREFNAMGAEIVGGHTIVGPRMEIGFTVIGNTDSETLRKGKLQPGDSLFVTKPLGIGVLLAAHMRSKCSSQHYQGVLDALLIRQHDFVDIAKAVQINAVTDVTGFGLAGHLIEMLQESGVSAEVDVSDIPVLDGVTQYITEGIESSLAPDNRRFDRFISADDSIKQLAPYKALFDPQTCGGLLFGINSDKHQELFDAMAKAELAPPIFLGKTGQASSGKQCLTILANEAHESSSPIEQ